MPTQTQSAQAEASEVQPPNSGSTAAGVVAFNPDINIIVPLVASVVSDVRYVVVFVNALIGDDVVDQLQQFGQHCQIVRSDYNLGVAEALNFIALHAALNGCSRVILFDQDSRPPARMIPNLCSAMDDLERTGEKVAVIGPRIVAPQGRAGEYKSPRYFRRRTKTPIGRLAPVEYIITSGTLLSLDAFRAIGTFRSDFFIDAIDTEWCFRAWATGYSCWFAEDVPMEHTIGEGAVRSRILRFRFPHQSRMRLYSFFRNQSACLLQPHMPVAWKIKFSLHMARVGLAMLVSSRSKASDARLIVHAVRDGLQNRLGPPPGAAHVVQRAHDGDAI